MDYIFYVIYNSYFKDGNYKNDIPSLTVGGIFTVTFFCIILLLKGIYTFYFFGNMPARSFGQFYNLLVGWGCAVLVFFMFYYNKRYVKIYNKYKDKLFANSLLGKISAWISVFILMASPFIFTSIRKAFL